MRYTRGLISVFIGLLTLLAIGAATAQDNTQPLILLIEGPFGAEGDLWAWTGGPTLHQKTHWEHNEAIRISPLQDEVAYLSTASHLVEANLDGMSGGQQPTNIWVINVEDDNAYRIAEQPDDGSFDYEALPQSGIIRSSPIWSPDGTQMAWVEGRSGSTEYSLMLYDKASQTSRLLSTDIPSQSDPFYPPEGAWTEKGIIVYSATYENSRDNLSALVFDPVSGKRRIAASIALPDFGKRSLWPWMRMPVEYQGETWLAALYVRETSGLECKLTDLDSGDTHPCPAIPTALIKDHTGTSLRVTPIPQNEEFPLYTLAQADGTPILAEEEPLILYRFALSPEGDAIAYQAYDETVNNDNQPVLMWNARETTVVPETGDPTSVIGLAWGTVTWVIPDETPQ